MKWPVFARKLKTDRGRNARSHRLTARVEGLESRCLMTAGSVTLSGALLTIIPTPTGTNTTTVSYQIHSGANMLDVNLNGTSFYFSLAQVGFVYYLGGGASGSQTFQDSTNFHVVAYGGSGSNLFMGGAGQDDFFGGSGSNTFDAGTGYDALIGGSGPNVFNENVTGSGFIQEVGTSNTVNVPAGATGHYQVLP